MGFASLSDSGSSSPVVELTCYGKANTTVAGDSRSAAVPELYWDGVLRMGYSLSWLAVRGKSPQVVRDELGFRPTGEREEFPESKLSAVEMPNGWYLIVSQRSELVASDAAMQRLSSSGGELVTCFVEEHVMFSSATGWKDGSKTWSVFHNAQDRRDHLDTQGKLPPVFSSIVEDLKTKQREADANKRRVDFIFDVPVALAHKLVGYRYDRDVPGLNGAAFEVLLGEVPDDPPPPKKSSFLKKLFGS